MHFIHNDICKIILQLAAQKSLWECSFEPIVSTDLFCGMIQDTTDQFDWNLIYKPEHSNSTGNFHISIEAGFWRRPGDKARYELYVTLIFPELFFSCSIYIYFIGGAVKNVLHFIIWLVKASTLYDLLNLLKNVYWCFKVLRLVQAYTMVEHSTWNILFEYRNNQMHW